MKTVHPNIIVLQQFNPSNISDSIEIIAEDAVSHYFNNVLPNMDGKYIGPEGFVEFFTKVADRTKGTFKVTPLSITPIGDELVVTHVKDIMNLSGQQIEVDAVVVWRIINGKIKEAWDIPAVYTAKLSDFN